MWARLYPTCEVRSPKACRIKRRVTRVISCLLVLDSLQPVSIGYRRVKANGGAAGVDDVSLKDFTEWFQPRREGLLRRLHLGTYHPSPVRRTYIEKKNGKQRPLGIPTVFDRMVQQAIHQVLCPILDQGFSENSYGFRPNCRGLDAVGSISQAIGEGYRWAIDIDLKSFFDKVAQSRALGALREHLDGDGPVTNLIKQYFKAGYIELGFPQRRIVL